MRIKAFTLVETLVAMVLSSLVIAMGYLGYSLVVKDFNAWSKSNNETTELLRLQNALNADFFKASEIRYRENNLTVIFENETEVGYSLEAGKIVRRTVDHEDSILVDVTEIKPMIIGPGGLISELVLIISANGRQSSVKFVKEYDAMTFIQNDSTMRLRENIWE